MGKNKLGKLYGIRKCANCGKDIEIFHKIRMQQKEVCCSVKCSIEHRKNKNLKKPGFLNCTCPVCNKKFHIKEYHKNRYKNHCCSMECNKRFRSIYMSGEGNHQYGLKGRKNATWKSDIRVNTYGYCEQRVLNHPFRRKGDWVSVQRLVAEKYLLNENNSIEINGQKYLRPEYCVHHIDFDRRNNDVNNLKVMTKKEHSSYHSNLRLNVPIIATSLTTKESKKYHNIITFARKIGVSTTEVIKASIKQQPIKDFVITIKK